MFDRQPLTWIARALCAGVLVCLILGASRLQAAAAADAIVACASPTGDLRIVGRGDVCRHNETTLTWNVEGPAGAAGPAGPAGADGPAGRDGRDGRDGGGATPPAPTVTAQMRIDGVNGGAATPVSSFSLGAADSVTSGGSGGGSGRVTFSNLVVSKTLDGDSVPLLQAASTGQILHTLSIDVFEAGSSTPFARYTFDDAIVTSTVLGTPGSIVGEQDAFDYRRITTDVTIGGQTFHSCFDVKALTSCS